MMDDFYIFSVLCCLNLSRSNNFLSDSDLVLVVFFATVLLFRVGALGLHLDKLKYAHNHLTFDIHFLSMIILIAWMMNGSARKNRYGINHLMDYITTPFFWINLIEYTLANLTDFYYYHLAVSFQNIGELIFAYGFVTIYIALFRRCGFGRFHAA